MSFCSSHFLMNLPAGQFQGENRSIKIISKTFSSPFIYNVNYLPWPDALAPPGNSRPPGPRHLSPGMAGYGFYSNRRGIFGIGGELFKLGGYGRDNSGVFQSSERFNSASGWSMAHPVTTNAFQSLEIRRQSLLGAGQL
jgi:hypothetical protein